jgi:hypothetical protein
MSWPQLPDPGHYSGFVSAISPLSTTGKLFEKLILKIFQRHIEERSQLNTSQFRFHARHSTTFQFVRLKDHVPLYFSNKMAAAAAFLGTEKAFDTI